MGKIRNSGLAHGTLGSPQCTIEQGDLNNKVDEISKKINQQVRTLQLSIMQIK